MFELSVVSGAIPSRTGSLVYRLASRVRSISSEWFLLSFLLQSRAVYARPTASYPQAQALVESSICLPTSHFVDPIWRAEEGFVFSSCRLDH